MERYYYIVAKATLIPINKQQQNTTERVMTNNFEECIVFTDCFYSSHKDLLNDELEAMKEILKKNIKFSEEYYFLESLDIILTLSLDDNYMIRVKENLSRNFHYVGYLRCFDVDKKTVSYQVLQGNLTIHKDIPFQDILKEAKRKAEENITLKASKFVFGEFREET